MTTTDGTWHDVAAIDELEDDDVMRVSANGAALALYNVDGKFYATDDCCTHEEASLSDGYLQDDTIECPRHQAIFHIPTGDVMSPPASVRLRTYPVRVDGDRVQVCL